MTERIKKIVMQSNQSEENTEYKMVTKSGNKYFHNEK